MKSPNDEMERLFLALSDKMRIKLIGLMSDGEVRVNYLCDILSESQPKVSRHLAYLRSTGVVTTRRDGKGIYYSLSWPTDPAGVKCFEGILNWITPSRSRQSGSQITNMEVDGTYEFGNVTVDHIYEEPHTPHRSQDDMDIFLL